jgi:hypothetical protein
LGSHAILSCMADDSPPPDAAAGRADARAKRRKRVFHTAGLTASAAVLALSIQAGSLSSDDDDAAPVNQYGDATILDPDAIE